MLGCGMLEQHRLAIRKSSYALCKQLMVDEALVQSLLADNILTESMAETILAEPTSQKRSFHLTLLLPKRGPRAFSSFCSALRVTEQQHLCDLLTQELEKDDRETHIPVLSCVCCLFAAESMEYSLYADSPIINTPVLPCTSDFYFSRRQQSYSMTSSPRGLALIISNVTFDSRTAVDLDRRKGGEVDEEVLRKVFTELDYIASVHRDLTAQEMRECMEAFCRKPEHRTLSSCVVCLLSHGVEGAVYGTDGQLLQLDWVFEAFDNARCPLLQNKPKMFFIQACRGEELDCGVEQIDGPGRTLSPSCEQRDAGREEAGDADSTQIGDMRRPRIKLPQRSDMICGFASLKGTAAMRNTKRGSWFIQELNAALRLHSKDTHLADILVQVNRRIKEREGYAPGTAHHRCKEMSEFTSSLCKHLYLFPKYQPQY
uniref:Caspase-2 n=1 Tax=Nothobranchius furzeri TaxID=105023 RepID=A0A8C6KCA8_NOTFU